MTRPGSRNQANLLMPFDSFRIDGDPLASPVLLLRADRRQIDAEPLQTHDDGQCRGGVLDDFFLHLDPAEIDEFRRGQAE